MKYFHRTVFVLVFLCALFMGTYIVFRVPEAQKVQSADGAVTITGLTRASQRMSVVVDDEISLGDPLRGLVYRVEPHDALLDAPVILSFARRDDLGTADATTVYQWQSALGMWIPVLSVAANTREVLAVEVLALGYFALGTSPNVAVPSLLAAQDILREKAPVGTRGYRISTAYVVPGGVPIAWGDAQVVGGCGGRVGAGDRVEYSSTTQSVSVLVNDVQTLVQFILVGEWILAGDGTGCPASLPLKAQEES